MPNALQFQETNHFFDLARDLFAVVNEPSCLGIFAEWVQLMSPKRTDCFWSLDPLIASSYSMIASSLSLVIS